MSRKGCDSSSITATAPAASTANSVWSDLLVCAAGYLLAAVAGGCGDQGAATTGTGAGTADPCADQCQKYAQVTYELNEDRIKLILKESSDDVRKTALGFAKEDAKELTSRCEKRCRSKDDVKRKVSSCNAKDRIGFLACMNKANPDDPKAEEGPHSCLVEKRSLCVDYTGADLTMSSVKSACRSLYEGKYEKAACSADDVVATCSIAKGTKGERTTFYYGKGTTVDQANQECVGEFAATGGAAAAGSASASASASTAPDGSASPAPSSSAAASASPSATAKP